MSEEQNNNAQYNHGYYAAPYYPQYYPYAYPYYYQQPRQFPLPPQGQQQQQQQQTTDVPGMLPLQQSYIENILRLNRGKHVTVYMTFEGNDQWNAKIFRGIIEAAGRDHIILSDPQSGKRYLLLMVYLDYVEFDEEINYLNPGLATFPPR